MASATVTVGCSRRIRSARALALAVAARDQDARADDSSCWYDTSADVQDSHIGGQPAPQVEMTSLSLAHLTVLDAHPLDLVEIAEASGYDAFGLRIVPPLPGDAIIPVVGDAPLQRRLKQRLASSSVKLMDIEAIWLGPETDVAALKPALDIGAELGARYVLVVGNDAERGRLLERFGELCDDCAERGLRTMLEFIPYSHVVSLADAASILRATMPRDAGLLVDALHLSRSGESPADMAAYPESWFSYLHLCDAAATKPAPDGLRGEARGGRLYPGEGALALIPLIQAIPTGTPVAIEAPSVKHAELSLKARATLAAKMTRALLAAVAAGADVGTGGASVQGNAKMGTGSP